MAAEHRRKLGPSLGLLGWTGALLALGLIASPPVSTQQAGLAGASQAAAKAADQTPVTPDMPFPAAKRDPEAIAAAKQVSVAPLLQRAADGKLVRVIVGVDASFVPEGHLDRDTVVRQRARMATAGDEVLSQMRRGSVGSVKRYETIPYFAAVVDDDALQTLSSLPGVTSIVEDRPKRRALMDSTGIVQATTVWQYGVGGAGWAVAIIDTGVDKTHPFLANKVVAEACFSTSDSSYSSLCPGGGSSSTAPGSGMNCPLIECDHGTHAAGVAAGRGPSFSGVARDASIIAIQVASRERGLVCSATSDCTTMLDNDILEGIEYVYQLRNTYRIAAVNLSLGGGQYSSQAECDAGDPAYKAVIDNLRSVGIATVAVSGNDGWSRYLNSPGCISSAVSVAATTKQDAVPYYSNTAPFLALFAPGHSIYSAVPGGGYEYKDGTSMAAPHVAGAWAILKALRPSGSVSELLGALRDTGKPVVDPVNSLAFPRIRLFDAAVVIYSGGGSTAPGAPSGLTASASGSNVSLAWNAPTTGGTPTTYMIEAGSGPGLANLANFSTGNTATSFAAGGVGSGVYYVRVRATNSAGTSGPSNEAIMTVGGGGCTSAPGAPSGLTITQNSGSAVGFTWLAASGNPSNYILEAGSASGLANLATVDVGTATTFSTGGVGAGTYYVRVRARNACGTSGPSNEVVLAVGTGGVCTAFSISPGATTPGAAAGSQAVAITGSPAGCSGGAWTASGNVSWLSVHPTSGTGSSAVTVSWLQNTSTSSRSGTATIAGRSFAVTQSGTGVSPDAAILEFVTDSSTCRCTYGTIVIKIDGSRVGTMSCTSSARFAVSAGGHRYSACDNVSCWASDKYVYLTRGEIRTIRLYCL